MFLGLASEKRGSPSSSRNKAAVIPPTEEDEEFYDDVLHPPETSKANEENQVSLSLQVFLHIWHVRNLPVF